MKKYSVKKNPRIYTPIENFRHLVSMCESRVGRPAFKYPKGKEFVTVAYDEFAAMVKSVAAGLKAAGLEGKRVAVIGETSPEWVATYLGVVAGGGVIIPMDKELAVSEIEGFLAGVDAEAIVYSGSFNDKLAPTIESHPTLKKFIPMSPKSEGESILPLN